MTKRMLYLLAILLISVLTVTAADHSEEVHCGDLSAADCQILMDNQAIMQDLNAFHFELAMDMEIQGTVSQEHLVLGMTGSGDLAMDSAAEGIDDMAAQAEAVIDSLAGQMRFIISIEDDGKTETIEVDMLMRDSVFLFTGSMVEELMGMPMEDMDWFGLDLTGAVAAILAQTGISEDDAHHDHDTSDYAEPEPVITRLDDAEVNGAPVAVFESTIDMETMMSGDAATLEELMAPLGLAGTLGAGSITNTHYIGLDDGYSYRQELSGAFSVSGLAIGETSGDMSATMSMTIDLSAFNEPVEVELPEDVPAFPLAMMLAMGSQ